MSLDLLRKTTMTSSRATNRLVFLFASNAKTRLLVLVLLFEQTSSRRQEEHGTVAIFSGICSQLWNN
jgi:hypothetical protein